MKLQELTDQGYALRAWMISTVRGERRIVLKLRRNERVYLAHSPFVDTVLTDVEFTEPTLLKWMSTSDPTRRH